MADITIIGGGIIGICSAIALQERGYSVEIVDPGDPRRGASFGNCGLVAAGEVVPISKPGIVPKIPKWLIDPEGPLFVRPKSLFPNLPWLLRFLAAGRPQRVRHIARALAPLTTRAEEDFRNLFAKAGMITDLVPAENIMAYDDRTTFEAEGFTWDLRRNCGFEHHALTAEELRQMEPSLGGPITCGVLLKGWLQFSEPGVVVEGLQKHFLTNGGRFLRASVRNIETTNGKALALGLENGERHPVVRLVLAAGAWSGRLARDLGLRIPIAALQGYHNHLPNPGVRLNRAVLYVNGGFVATPMKTGLRIGGTIEIAGHDPKPNFRRADVITRKAGRILPGLNVEGGTQWMGPRPFMPDTLPVIGRAPHHDNVILAFGHGQVGMTLGATTGQLVTELVEQRPSLDLAPYAATRF